MLAFYLTLVQSEKDSQKVAFIYEKYYSAMYYSAMKVLGSKSGAEDAVHDAMIKIIQNLDSVDFENGRKLKTFCCIVARNKAIDNQRRDRAITSVELIDDIASDRSGESPEEIVISKETYETLVGAINSLSDVYKDVCYLRFIYNMKEREIASLLDVSEKTVEARIRRGKELVKKMIGKVY